MPPPPDLFIKGPAQPDEANPSSTGVEPSLPRVNRPLLEPKHHPRERIRPMGGKKPFQFNIKDKELFDPNIHSSLPNKTPSHPNKNMALPKASLQLPSKHMKTQMSPTSDQMYTQGVRRSQPQPNQDFDKNKSLEQLQRGVESSGLPVSGVDQIPSQGGGPLPIAAPLETSQSQPVTQSDQLSGDQNDSILDTLPKRRCRKFESIAVKNVEINKVIYLIGQYLY